MNEQSTVAITEALDSITYAISDLAEQVEALTTIMTRLTFVDYGGYEDNQKPLNLRVFINGGT
jgi:hypothetical protein